MPHGYRVDMVLVYSSIASGSSVHGYGTRVQEYSGTWLVEYMDALDRLRPLGTTWYVVVYSYMGRLDGYGSIVAR